MKNIANLLFEARILKEIPRSGYQFLGAGKESVAEHSFSITFIAYVIAQIEPDINALKLITMCLVHDLPEARTGDLNYVQKKYVHADENSALNDIIKGISFGQSIADLIVEFNDAKSHEARLAYDADQISFIMELKTLLDTGYSTPAKWLPIVIKRLKTETGKKIALSILNTDKDSWWLDNYIDRHHGNN